MKDLNDPKGERASLHPSHYLNRVGGMTPLFLADGDGGGDGGDTSGGDSGDKGKSETFTKEQMEQYMNSHLSKARKSWERERTDIEKNLYTKLGISSAEEIEEINRLRDEAKQAEQRKREEKGEYEKILAERDRKHREREQELQNKILQSDNNFLDLAKEINISQAALKAGAEPATLKMLVAFIKPQVKVVDKDTVVPIDSHGEVPLNPETGKEMTLNDFMKSFLAESPNLVKGSGTSGAGSSGTQTKHGKLSLEEVKRIAKTDPARYAELKKDGTIQQVVDASVQKE